MISNTVKALKYASNLRRLFFATGIQHESQLVLSRSASSGQRGGRGGRGGGGGGGGGGGRSGGGGGSFAASGYNNKGNSSSSTSTVGRSSIANNDHHHHNSSSSLPKVTSPELQIVANEEIAKKAGGLDALVRVIVAEDKSNLGVISVADAMSAAKSRGLDVVMIATPPGSPPVCRLISLASYKIERKEAAEKEREREREAKIAQEALAQEARKQKEIRLTTRTDDHDLGVKCSKIVEFLRASHSVRVSVSFSKSTSAWVKEEPHRRAMFAAVVRAVMASGAGHIDPNSIQGSGANLVGLFSPNKLTTTSTSTAPRGSSEWDKVLNKLSDPRGLRPDEGEVPSFVKSAMLPTSSTTTTTANISETIIAQTQASKTSSALPPPYPSSSSSSSSLSSSTLPVLPPSVKNPSLASDFLPPVEMLIRSSRRVSHRSSSSLNASTSSAAPSPPADDEDRGISASGMGDVRFKIGGGKAGGGGGGSTSGIVVKGRRSALSGGGARGGGSNSGGGGGGRGRR